MTEPLLYLRGVGQSIWYDNIRRALLENLLERGRRIGRVTLADLRQVTRVASTEHDQALAARSS